jgi:hypothetical protein
MGRIAAQRNIVRNLLALLLGAGALAAPAAPVSAGIFTVDTLDDAGMGSLRQAVADANANMGSDDIVFADGLSGTIELTSGEIAITDHVTIVGPGARVLAVDSTARIFNIGGQANEVEVVIAYLTLQGGVAPLFGNGGGIIATNARFNLTEVTMTGNAAATGEGGAISCTTGSLSLERVTLSGNSAAKAGALHLVLCSLDNMSNSTVSGNTASDSVGGIKLEFVGATIANSTVADNRATGSQGGILLNQGNTLNLISTIVADNTDGAGGSDLVRFGANSTINAEYSLIETPPVANTINGTDVGNLIGVDPQLEALDNNGGPTDTHALPDTSPALDRGANPFFEITDQRGQPYQREIGGGTDIGAYERQTSSGAPAASTLALAMLAAALLAFGVRRA